MSPSDRKLPDTVRERGLFYPSDAWREALKAFTQASVRLPVYLPPVSHFADPMRGLFAGMTIGLLLPVATRPFDKLQVFVNTTPDKITWNSTFAVLRNNPYKGLLSRMMANTARTTILFYTMPLTQNVMQDYGYSQAASEKTAPAIAGALCGALMTPYTILDQRYQISGAKSWGQVWNNFPQGDFKKVLPKAFGLGVMIDMSFWTIYSEWVARVEKQLCIATQKDSLTKLWEEVAVGALACVLTLPITFPMHALQTRLINDARLSIRGDFQRPQFTSSVDKARKHYYRGFMTGVVRMSLAMSVLNGLKYSANLVYDNYLHAAPVLKNAKSQLFFKPHVNADVCETANVKQSHSLNKPR